MTLLAVLGPPGFGEGREPARCGTVTAPLVAGANRLRDFFLDSGEQALFWDWDLGAAGLVAGLRQSVGLDTSDPRCIELVGGLPLASTCFLQLWARHYVGVRQGELMRFRRVTTFVVNMSTVFEDLVTTALAEALAGHPGTTGAQYPAFLESASGLPSSARIRMYINVVHEVRGQPALIFDDKYKAASWSGAYPKADYYQMLAYCTALELLRAWLVYSGAGNLVFGGSEQFRFDC